MKIITTGFFLLLASLMIAGCGSEDDKLVGEDEQVRLFTESGELMAVRNTAVSMPRFRRSYGEPQITWLEEEGKVVEQGDTVALIDAAEVLKALDIKESELEISMADLSNSKIIQAVEIHKLESDLKHALSRLRQAEIDTQRVAYESISSKESAQLKLESEKISYEKSRRKVISTMLLQEQDLIIQRIRINQTSRDVEVAKQTLENFIIRAPAPGMIVHSWNRSTRSKVQVGDKLYWGRPIVQLPDLTRMKASTSVNETDISRVFVGQKVRVRLDAYPRVPFDAEIVWISSACHKKDRDSKIKVFDAEVLLTGNDKILKPGMTVSCEFLGSARELALGPAPDSAAGQAGE
jgi:HlyD family secretion protein